MRRNVDLTPANIDRELLRLQVARRVRVGALGVDGAFVVAYVGGFTLVPSALAISAERTRLEQAQIRARLEGRTLIVDDASLASVGVLGAVLRPFRGPNVVIAATTQHLFDTLPGPGGPRGVSGGMSGGETGGEAGGSRYRVWPDHVARYPGSEMVANPRRIRGVF